MSGVVGATGGAGAAGGAAGASGVPRRRDALDWLAIVVGSVAFTGFAPVAPATVASAVVAVVLFFAYPLGSWWSYWVVAGALMVAGAWASTRLERLFGHDPSAATIDEALGMAVTLAWAPITPATVVLAFGLFRVFDVVKLPPGRALERVQGGWGVILDDLSAGIYAALVLQGLLRVWPDPQLLSWPFAVAALGLIPLVVFRKPLARRYMKKRSRLRDAMP